MRPCIAAALCVLWLAPVLGAQANTPTPPTANEALMIYEINRARANPQAYDTEKALGGVLAGITPAPPLALNQRLVTSSRFHSDEMAANGYFDHTSAVTGDQPNRMVRNAGYPLKSTFPDNANYVESLAVLYTTGTNPVTYTPADSVRDLILDQGVVPPGHRYHLLAWGGSQSDINFYRAFREIGTGYATGFAPTAPPLSGRGAYWSIHTGVRDTDQFWLCGFVYNDANTNARLDGGEGLTGVNVSATNGAQTFNVNTTDGGAWAIQVAPGTWTLTASGGAFTGTRNVQVVVSGASVSVDFRGNSNLVDIGFGAWGALPESGSVDGSGTATGAPVFNSAPPPTSARAGFLWSHTFSAIGNPAPTLNATGLPSWLSFNAGTGQMSGTPTEADRGTSSFIQVTATNGVAPDASYTFSLVVINDSGSSSDGGGGGCAAGVSALPLWLLLLYRRRRGQ